MKLSLKTSSILFTVIMLLFSCSVRSQISSKENITGVAVTLLFPFFDEKGAFLKNDTSYVNIYYYKDMILYDDSLRWETYTQGVKTKAEMLPNFFVITKGKSNGYLFSTCRPPMDSCVGPYEKKLQVDSFLKEQWYNKFNLKPDNTMTLLSEQFNTDSGRLDRQYFLREKKDTVISGQLILSFSNRLPKVDYCLYKQLDTVPNMKLCKVKTIVDIRPMKRYKGGADIITLSTELTEVVLKNKNELLQYFERAKQNELKEQKGKL
jgi:hypothetical protein